MFKLNKYTKEQIYTEILWRADHDTLLDFARHSKEMQLKLKGFRLNKKGCQKEKLIKTFMELSVSNSKIENYILNLWEREVLYEKIRFPKINTKKKAEAYINSEKFQGDYFVAATLLMTYDNKTLNTLGEEYYSRYLEQKSQIGGKESKKEVEDSNMSTENIETANLVSDDAEDMKEIENIKTADILDLPISQYIKLYEKYKKSRK